MWNSYLLQVTAAAVIANGQNNSGLPWVHIKLAIMLFTYPCITSKLLQKRKKCEIRYSDTSKMMIKYKLYHTMLSNFLPFLMKKLEFLLQDLRHTHLPQSTPCRAVVMVRLLLFRLLPFRLLQLRQEVHCQQARSISYNFLVADYEYSTATLSCKSLRHFSEVHIQLLACCIYSCLVYQ